MAEFHRTPSKVWWAEESFSWSSSHSASPGSQDSGFSDTETSPPMGQAQSQPQPATPDRKISDALAKNGATPKGNLTSEIIEKTTPDKQFVSTPTKSYYLPKEAATEPRRLPSNGLEKSPVSKVSRNLFRSMQLLKYTNEEGTPGTDTESQYSPTLDATRADITSNRTLPMISGGGGTYPPNLSAPPALYQCVEEGSSVLNDSETDLEMEAYFQTRTPKHASTPKLMVKPPQQKLGRIHAMNLMAKHCGSMPKDILREQRGKNPALDEWVTHQRQTVEAECMTALQCKSIAADLAEKVTRVATLCSNLLRCTLRINEDIISSFNHYKNNKEARHSAHTRLFPLIEEYLKMIPRDLAAIDEMLFNARTEANTINLTQLQKSYSQIHEANLNRVLECFLEGLTDLKSEMSVRAHLTALTSLSQRHPELIPPFIQLGSIQIITALLDKCEGSSVRGLALRAMTTLCINAESIRKFESVSGLPAISDIICDPSRPESERTEAIALLAQITAPWIDDNHSVHSLHGYTKRLVKYVTRYLKSASCCQNILLASAALANLAAMDPKAIKPICQQGTVSVLLDIVRQHGNIASVYILEQIAALIATMSSYPEACRALTEIGAPQALLQFLQIAFCQQDVIVRLQQKVVIALSRLCGEVEGAVQVVNVGGVEKLVALCKNKCDRFDNDAVLVAALATLRKITESCGMDVIGEDDAQELIQPKLMDSFKAYSKQSESLV